MGRRAGMFPTMGTLWPDEKMGPYEIMVHVEEIDGRPQCVGIELWGKEPPPRIPHRHPHVQGRPAAIGSRTVRESLKIETLLSELGARTARVLSAAADQGVLSDEAQRSADAAVRAWERSGRRGPKPRYGKAHWRQVADVYKHRASDGFHDPTQAVANHFGVRRSTANKWVAKARELGLLPPTTRGKARGGRRR